MTEFVPATEVELRRFKVGATILHQPKFTEHSRDGADRFPTKEVYRTLTGDIYGLAHSEPILISVAATWVDMLIPTLPSWLRRFCRQPRVIQKPLDVRLLLPRLQLNIPPDVAGGCVVVSIAGQNRTYVAKP